MVPVHDPDPAASHRRLSLFWLTGVVGLAIVLLCVFWALRRPHNTPGAAGSPASRPAASSSPAPARALPDFEVKPASVEEGEAKWYDVPDDSLAQRRAWPGELTAASDRLAKNTYVRVRRIDAKADPDKTVVVRITDDGVQDRATLIDLDRDAAETLGMVKAGQVRVRVETLALKNATTDKPVEKKNDAPVAPKASELTDKPTASKEQEKDAAKAKAGGNGVP